MTIYNMEKLGYEIDKAKLKKWIIEEGQSVCAGEALFEVETMKVNIEVVTPCDMKVVKLLVLPGDELTASSSILEAKV